MSRLSFRARLMLLVAGVGLLPLLVIGTWVTSTAARVGERLLREGLRDSIDATAAALGPRWIVVRGSLLDLADETRVLSGAGVADADSWNRMAERLLSPHEAIVAVRLLAEATDTVAEWQRAGSRGATFSVRYLITPDGPTSAGVMMEADLLAQPFIDAELGRGRPASMIFAVSDAATLAPLLPLSIDERQLRLHRFEVGGERWIAETRTLVDPPLELAAAAPLDDFIEPFRRAARRGMWLLLLVASAGLIAAALIMIRMTRSLHRLAGAARRVAAGELGLALEPAADREFDDVVTAFNTMSRSLDRTLRELTSQRSLAAVGEFASELAHEVRNPLTAIRVNLQVAQERLPADSPAAEAQEAALDEVDRLDRTVSGVLRLARSGRVAARPLDLREPLTAAVRAVRPIVEKRPAALEVNLDAAMPMVGDPDALQQMLLNLLVNAAQAVPAGGAVRVSSHTTDGSAVVTIEDDGPGLSEEAMARIREPFYSTRPSGAGLGVGIADRIARAHNGEIRFGMRDGGGTRVEVVLPVETA